MKGQGRVLVFLDHYLKDLIQVLKHKRVIMKLVSYNLDLIAILRGEVQVELGDQINNLRLAEMVTIRRVINLVEAGGPLDVGTEGEGGTNIAEIYSL